MIRALLVALLLAGCGGTTASVESEVPGFDISSVRGNFTAECDSPIVVDDLFCDQVLVDEMTADGTTLMVPTTLNAEARDRASAICEQLATAHFDGDGADLGYEYIGVLDRDGGNAAACSV